MSTPAKFNGPDVQLVSSGPPESSEPFQSAIPRAAWLTATRILIACNLLIFWAMLAHSISITGVDKFLNTRIGESFDSELLLKWGSDFGPLTLGGHYWRVITSNFLHKNIVHLASNMLFLWRLGTALDRLFSRTQTLVVYLLTGVASSLVSLSWHPTVNSSGASGAIYGHAGVLIALLGLAKLDWSRRNKISTLLWIILMTPFDVLSGHFFKEINYAAHVGGFVCGLLIGGLLARTFRMPQTKRVARQWRFLAFVTEALVVIFAMVIQLRSDVVKQYREDLALRFDPARARKTQVSRVFTNLTGNPKLVHRLSSFLKFGLEDAGIMVTITEAEADAVIRGEVSARIEESNLGLGVIRMQLTANGSVEKMEFCASLSTAEDGEFFDGSAEDAAREVRKKYPDARTVKLDSASEMSASKEFGLTFPSELKASGFSVTESMPADLILRINLVRQKVPIEKSVLDYKLRVVNRNGIVLTSESGDAALFAKMSAVAPAVCPDRFADLGWMSGNDPFFSIAGSIVKDLRKSNADPPVSDHVSKPK